MGGSVKIDRSMRSRKSLRMPQDRFSRGGWLLGYPLLRGRVSSMRSFARQPVRQFSAATKTLLTLPSLWTQRTRPQGTWKTAKSAVFHSANSDHLFLKEEKERRT